ncbi:MAG: adenylate kinase [Parachlamydiaceae bacterium]|nr:adenylate kinase [Parachlamydiaceae bacterium]
MRKVIILLGPPGSGKGTQAVKLTKELGVPHISTGDLFRDNLSRQTALGEKIKGYMDKGLLVPDALVLDMLFDRVAKPDCDKGYLLDGFPRTLPQAEALEKHLGDSADLRVLNLLVEDDVIFKRMAGRLTCRHCGNVQNKFLAPPAKEGVCDRCESELYQRPDDKAEVVQERLRIYHDQTKPLIQFYQQRDVLVVLDGDRDPIHVFQDLVKAIG